MEIYECVLSLISGIGVFILAMKLLSDSLNTLAGEKMKLLLQKIAGNRITGVLIGAFVTAVIHSSAATTLMVIGFVNSNMMDLYQASAIIIGANIGTTTTGFLASLESFNISLFLSLFCFIGVMLAFIKKIKKIANLMSGLGMIFVGLKLMSSACNDDSIKSFMADVLQKISFPLVLEFFGIIFTAIIQSSSAMTGIIIVMVGNGAMGLDSGLFITLGANVGTCVTALIGIIGANDNSKRTAVIHLVFNICGVLIFTPILWIFKSQIINILGSLVSKEAMQIAYFHLCFNITTALITTPLIDYLEKIAYFVIKEPQEDVIESFIKEKENFDIGHRDTTTDIEADVNKEKDEENKIINEKDDKEKDEKYEPPKVEEKDKENKEEKVEVKDDKKDEEKKEEKKENDNVEEKHENKDDEKIDVKDTKEEKKKDDDNAEEKQEKKDEENEVNNKEDEKKEE